MNTNIKQDEEFVLYEITRFDEDIKTKILCRDITDLFLDIEQQWFAVKSIKSIAETVYISNSLLLPNRTKWV